MTRHDHLVRVLRQHRSDGHGCTCGHPHGWPEHIALLVATITDNCDIAGLPKT